MKSAPLSQLLGDNPHGWAYDGNKILYTVSGSDLGGESAWSEQGETLIADAFPGTKRNVRSP